MKTIYKHMGIAITVMLLVITIYSISFTSPARKRISNTSRDINVELSSDPKSTLAISADTDFLSNDNSNKAAINVRVLVDGVESNVLREGVTLEILGLQQGQGYIPIGKGHLHPTENWPINNQWLYRAFKEPTTEKHPLPKRVAIGAKYGGKPVGNRVKIGVNPVFYWRTVFHQHGPDYYYAPRTPHVPTNSDYNYAWKYARWKYGIDTSNLSSIQYNNSLGTAGLTNTITNAAELGLGAFASENVCASTLGHENVHGGQSKIFRTLQPSAAEVEAYQWELDHAAQTGLTAQDIADVKACRDYYNNVPNTTCGG